MAHVIELAIDRGGQRWVYVLELAIIRGAMAPLAPPVPAPLNPWNSSVFQPYGGTKIN